MLGRSESPNILIENFDLFQLNAPILYLKKQIPQVTLFQTQTGDLVSSFQIVKAKRDIKAPGKPNQGFAVAGNFKFSY